MDKRKFEKNNNAECRENVIALKRDFLQMTFLAHLSKCDKKGAYVYHTYIDSNDADNNEDCYFTVNPDVIPPSGVGTECDFS